MRERGIDSTSVGKKKGKRQVKRISGVGDKSRAREIDVSMALNVAKW